MAFSVKQIDFTVDFADVCSIWKQGFPEDASFVEPFLSATADDDRSERLAEAVFLDDRGESGKTFVFHLEFRKNGELDAYGHIVADMLQACSIFSDLVFSKIDGCSIC